MPHAEVLPAERHCVCDDRCLFLVQRQTDEGTMLQTTDEKRETFEVDLCSPNPLGDKPIVNVTMHSRLIWIRQNGEQYTIKDGVIICIVGNRIKISGIKIEH
jgi:hypothetical protein